MGTRYVALNHDTKQAFAVGRMSFQDYGEHTNYNTVPYLPKTHTEMLNYLIAEGYDEELAWNLGIRLHAFGVQEVQDTCSDIVEDEYGDYIMVDSVYVSDSSLNKPLNHWM